MRIIAGTRARMILLPPRTRTTRPITDRVKESVFAIMTPFLPNAVVADLFCGTGSLGLEALSRGGAHAIMFEQDADALKRLKKNIKKLHFEAQTTLVPGDAFRHPLTGPIDVRDEQAQQQRYCNVVFIDPPYRLSRQTSPDSQLAGLLVKLSPQVADRAVVVVRHAAKTEFARRYEDLHLYDRRRYGSMAVTFLQKVVH